MDNYLKGKTKLNESNNHLVSIQKSLSSNIGIPDKKTDRIEITGKEGEPTIECVTLDGRITRIIVTCSCGQVIELDCKYS